MDQDERVLCISEEHFQTVGLFQGLKSHEDYDLDRLLNPSEFQFIPRSLAEMDPSFKQLIPYVVLKYRELLFHYRRTSKGTEKRLKNMRSIGIGGHICDRDAIDSRDVYLAGMMRELDEEVTFSGLVNRKGYGVIYDGRSDVGRVHLGIIHLIELENRQVELKDSHLIEGGFDAGVKLWKERDEFETWSQLLLEQLNNKADPFFGSA